MRNINEKKVHKLGEEIWRLIDGKNRGEAIFALVACLETISDETIDPEISYFFSRIFLLLSYRIDKTIPESTH